MLRAASRSERSALPSHDDASGKLSATGSSPLERIKLLEVAGIRVLAERLLRFVSKRPDVACSPPELLKIKGELPDRQRLAQACEVLAALA